MATTIKGKNIHISDKTRNHIEKRISKFGRFLKTIQDVRVDLVRESTKSQADRFVAQITVYSEGKILRAEERNQEVLTAFDITCDKVNHQIARLKGKKLNRWQASESIRTSDEFPPISDETFNTLAEESNRKIVRVKQFSITPMSEEEALEQIQLLSHDFFIFFNANSGRINVLYKRTDNNYGLIDPIVE